MKSKQTIQQKIQELKKDYKELNHQYQHLMFLSDVSNGLDSIESQIEMLEWVLKEE